MSDDVRRRTGRRSRTTPGGRTAIIDGAPGAMLVIISGPSGVGKDTIIDALRRARPTTRSTTTS